MKIMIVGNFGVQLAKACQIVSDAGAKVYTCDDAESALHALRQGRSCDLLMVDVKQDIAKFIGDLKLERIYATIVACGIDVNKDDAVAAIKAGAKEYIPMPPDQDLIVAMLEAITGSDDYNVVYKSAEFQKVIDLANQIAPSEASVLITGESGTGKEVISKYIHRKSARSGAEFVSLNCAAIPENLLESELFGHEKGAFTGAIEKRIGKFEEANNGTILLDEISEMDIKLQSKLLRAIQERVIVRVGGNKEIPLNIRIIATTNRNLVEEVSAGRFREDLFFRLNVINVAMPALRDRKADIEPLSNFFVEKYCKLNGLEQKTLISTTVYKLEDYNWPGNVRELENAIHRAVLLSTSNEIGPESIHLTMMANKADNENSSTLEEIEKNAIRNTYSKCYGDEVKAAAVLGISLRALKSKLQQYKIANS